MLSRTSGRSAANAVTASRKASVADTGVIAMAASGGAALGIGGVVDAPYLAVDEQRPFQDGRAEPGQQCPARRPRQQRNAKFRLQIDDRAADGGLGHAETPGRALQAAGFGDRPQGLQLEFHGGPKRNARV